MGCGAEKKEVIDKLTGNEYRVSTRRNGGDGYVYASEVWGKEGTKVIIRAEASKGYAFSEWQIQGSKAECKDLNSAETTLTIGDSDVIATAIFVPSVDGAEVELSEASFTYNGEVQKTTIKSVGGRAFSEDYCEVEWSNENSTEVGTYTVTITGKNGITGTTQASYQIIKADQSDDTGNDPGSDNPGGDNTGDNSGTNNTGNNPGTDNTVLNIAGAKVVLSKSSFTYNGKVQKPFIKTIKGLALKAGTDYTASWSNASSRNVGTYTVTITGKGNYTGKIKATYKINPKGTRLKTLKRAKKAITVNGRGRQRRCRNLVSRDTRYSWQLTESSSRTRRP